MDCRVFSALPAADQKNWLESPGGEGLGGWPGRDEVEGLWPEQRTAV